MTSLGMLAAALLGAAGVALLVPSRRRPDPGDAGAPGAPGAPSSSGHAGEGWMRRGRWWWSVLAGSAAWVFLGGPAGVVAGVLAAAGCWVVIGRAEPPRARREREALQRDLPVVVRLLGAALAAGSSPPVALATVAEALPGPAANRLASVAARLRLGADPVETWRGLAAEPALAPLGRTLARAQASGAPVVASIERLGEELARAARADAEDRARAVGVKAAIPLGLCLLPAFVLIGIVPVVGGLLGGLGL